MMKTIKLVNSYIAKGFLLKFLQITLGFSLLIFFINIIETMERARESGTPFTIIATMAFLQIPDFLNDIVPSLILISAIVTFFTFSSRSEITILRSSGFSLWQILKPISSAAVLLGIFWITIFNPLSIKMVKKFYNLEGTYIEKDSRESVTPKNGIWLKQNNIDNPTEEIIIQARKIYKEDVEFVDVKIWFFNKNNEFYQKIDAEKMKLLGQTWQIKNAILNDANNLNKKIPEMVIKTDLQADFIIEKVVNNFQNVKLFNIFEIPPLIKNLQSSGFSPIKFKVYFHSLLSKPLLFLAMTLIACFFGLNHIRSNNTILMIFLGIALGLVLYISSSVINALGSSGLIPIFASTWIIAIITLAVGILLIYKKEHI